ncbi:MAG TPA: ribose 5-phosphate isomerase B, partial [Oculatellaceae cyanobacterium]
MDKQVEKVILGADHAGYRLKEHLADAFRRMGLQVEDVGCFDENSVDYPDISRKLAKALQAEPETTRGVLCCGSGVGICIAANRFPWIRAVVAHDHNTAVMSRRHNDTNVLCMGGRVIAPELAETIAKTWLETPFEGGRHQRRVDLMSNLH